MIKDDAGKCLGHSTIALNSVKEDYILVTLTAGRLFIWLWRITHVYSWIRRPCSGWSVIANVFHKGAFPDFLIFAKYLEINANGSCHLSHSQKPGISLISLFLSTRGYQGRQIKRSDHKELPLWRCSFAHSKERCQTLQGSLEEQAGGVQIFS